MFVDENPNFFKQKFIDHYEEKVREVHQKLDQTLKM